jgi:hypothetical protein
MTTSSKIILFSLLMGVVMAAYNDLETITMNSLLVNDQVILFLTRFHPDSALVQSYQKDWWRNLRISLRWNQHPNR